MSEPRQITPRKTPTQERSKQKVEQILQAAVDVLSSDGVEKFTTISIAKKSGMSVGSLYQYFPNKQSILSELFLRWTGDSLSRVEAFEKSAVKSSLDDLVDKLLAALAQNDEGLLTNSSFESELIKAIGIFPELRELDRLHGERFCQLMSRILKKAGAKASARERTHLAQYIYELDAAFWEATTKGVPVKLANHWHRVAIKGVLSSYF